MIYVSPPECARVGAPASEEARRDRAGSEARGAASEVASQVSEMLLFKGSLEISIRILKCFYISDAHGRRFLTRAWRLGNFLGGSGVVGLRRRVDVALE